MTSELKIEGDRFVDYVTKSIHNENMDTVICFKCSFEHDEHSVVCPACGNDP